MWGWAKVQAAVPHPISGDPITGPFYPEGATWDSTFQKIASTYEECRAECSGLYLCDLPDVLSVFGHTAAETTEVLHPDGTTITTVSDKAVGTTTTVVHPDGTTLSTTCIPDDTGAGGDGIHDVT